MVISFLKFRKILMKKKEFTYILDFFVKGINSPFHEEYHFELQDNIIISYENGIEFCRTNSFSHMFFIYKKIFQCTKKKKKIANKYFGFGSVYGK